MAGKSPFDVAETCFVFALLFDTRKGIGSPLNRLGTGNTDWHLSHFDKELPLIIACVDPYAFVPWTATKKALALMTYS